MFRPFCQVAVLPLSKKDTLIPTAREVLGLLQPLGNTASATVHILVRVPPHVVDGRFKGGWTTRHYGNPTGGVHAIQMELADRGYMDEPNEMTPANWPTPYDPARAAVMRAALTKILTACLNFADTESDR